MRKRLQLVRRDRAHVDSQAVTFLAPPARSTRQK